MELRKIVLARVANDEYDDRVLVEVARNTQRRGEVRARRTSAKNSFDAAQLTRTFERVVVVDVDYLVDVLHVRVARQDFLADAFDQVRRRLRHLAGLFVGFVDRAERVGADDFDVWVFLFQISAGPGNGST